MLWPKRSGWFVGPLSISWTLMSGRETGETITSTAGLWLSAQWFFTLLCGYPPPRGKNSVTCGGKECVEFELEYHYVRKGFQGLRRVVQGIIPLRVTCCRSEAVTRICKCAKRPKRLWPSQISVPQWTVTLRAERALWTAAAIPVGDAATWDLQRPWKLSLMVILVS